MKSLDSAHAPKQLRPKAIMLSAPLDKIRQFFKKLFKGKP
jgi:hypothetical protein